MKLQWMDAKLAITVGGGICWMVLIFNCSEYYGVSG
jgi:hypothetical protein